jgi:hypothetical protein
VDQSEGGVVDGDESPDLGRKLFQELAHALGTGE